MAERQPDGAGEDDPDPFDLDGVLDRLDGIGPEPPDPPDMLALFTAADIVAPTAGWAAELIVFPDLRPPGASPWRTPPSWSGGDPARRRADRAGAPGRGPGGAARRREPGRPPPGWWGFLDDMMAGELPDLDFSLDDLPRLDPPEPDPEARRVVAVIDTVLARPRLLVGSERAFLAEARRDALASRLTEDQQRRVMAIARSLAEPAMA